jgi:hypothetical protein
MAADRDLPPATDGGPFPLVLFSHGSVGYRLQSTFLTTHLASGGFVVASVRASLSKPHRGVRRPERSPARSARIDRPTRRAARSAIDIVKAESNDPNSASTASRSTRRTGSRRPLAFGRVRSVRRCARSPDRELRRASVPCRRDRRRPRRATTIGGPAPPAKPSLLAWDGRRDRFTSAPKLPTPASPPPSAHGHRWHDPPRVH